MGFPKEGCIFYVKFRLHLNQAVVQLSTAGLRNNYINTAKKDSKKRINVWRTKRLVSTVWL
jgi:hypothetical protein